MRVLNLVDDEDLLKELDSFTHESIDSLDNYKKNVFSDDELLIIVSDLDSLTDSDFFKKNYGLQNIMLLITNDDKFKRNNAKYLNMFFGYGYKYFGPSNNDRVQVFIYDISDYIKLKLPKVFREVLLHGWATLDPCRHLKFLFVEKNYYPETSIPKKIDNRTTNTNIANHIKHCDATFTKEPLSIPFNGIHV